MADGVLDKLLQELESDAKLKLIERAMKDVDIGRYDKPIRKLVDEAFEDMLKRAKAPDERDRRWSSVHTVVESAIGQWAERRVKEILSDPKKVKELEPILKTAVDDALRQTAQKARFRVSIDTSNF